MSAGNQLSFFSFFLLLLIVGGGIVGGVYLYYGGGADYRVTQSGAFAYMLERCVQQGLFDGTFGSCGIDEQVVTRERYIVAVCTDDCFGNGGTTLLRAGDHVEQCRFGVKQSATYPKCAERVFTVDGKNYQIVVGTTYRGRNA